MPSSREALAQYDLVILRAVKEVEDALVACRNERVRYRNLADAVDANRAGGIARNRPVQ